MKTPLHCCLLLGLLFPTCHASAQDILWERSYGGKHADHLFDAIATPDHGFILAGSSLSRKTGNKTDENQGDLDYWIWKMDERGEPEWQKSFGGPGADLLQCVRLTADAGFFLAGTSESGIGSHKKDACKGKADYWVIKLDAKGNEQWQRTIGGTGLEQLQSACQTFDGGYILGGSSSSERTRPDVKGKEDPFGKKQDGLGNLDYWVVKLDAKGDIQWQQTIGGSQADVLRSIEQTSDGGYILGGSSNSPESGSKTESCHGAGDYWVVKLDSKGAITWQKAYGGDGDDQLYAVRQTLDGNYIAAGNSGSGATGNKSKGNKAGTDFWLVKLAEGGESLWQETYDIGKTDLLISMVENGDRTLLLGGYAKGEAMARGNAKDREGINDFAAIKVAEDGKELWTQTVGSAGDDFLRKAVETRDGGYLLAGTSSGPASRDRHSGIGSQDFWVVKLGDRDKKKETPNGIEAYPNPTQRFTNVIVGHDFERAYCHVFDLAGRQVQHFLVTTGRTVPVDLGGLPEGIYLIEIRTNVQNGAVKVIKTLNKN